MLILALIGLLPLHPPSSEPMSLAMPSTEVIYCGDNLRVLPRYIADESVDLVYIDPPFNTGRTYEVFWGEEQERRAYEDRFGDPYLYLDWMAPRFEELYRVLKPTGSFYIHCDPTSSHYLKVFLDRLFGWRRFRSEIVWKRNSAHSDTKQGRQQHGRVHDVLLFYTKEDTWTWHTLYQPYDPGYIESKYHHIDPVTGRLYRLDNLTGPGGAAKGNPSYEVMGVTRHWRFSKEKMDNLIAEGRVVQTRPGSVPQYKRYLDEMPGVPLQDIWTDIPPVNSQARERLGWPTQKPVPLLERIIKTSSSEGDVVLDAFCGCGTTLEAAVRLKRRWIGIDFSPTACRVMARRLEDRCHLVERKDFRLVDLPRGKDELRRMPPLEFENWAVTALGGIPNRVKHADFGIDGRLYVADRSKPLSEQRDLFGRVGSHWFPIQVKQKDKAGRPDIDLFVSAMRRDRRGRGYFVSFSYTREAEAEIRRLVREDGLEIIPVTVDQILADETALYGEPPAEISVARIRQQSVQRPIYDAAPPEEQQPVTGAAARREAAVNEPLDDRSGVDFATVRRYKR